MTTWHVDDTRKKALKTPLVGLQPTLTSPHHTSQMNPSIVQRAQERPNLLTAPDVGVLQRTIGNRAVQTLLNRQSRGQTAPQRIQREPDDNSNLLNTFVENHHVSPFLREFAAKEWSAENFDFVQAVRHYRKNPSLKMAKVIYERYIREGAPQMVNLSAPAFSKVSEEIEQISKMKWWQWQQKKEQLSTLFDDAYKDAIANLTDTVARYKEAGLYKQVTQKLEDVKQMGWHARMQDWRKGVNIKRGAYGKLKGKNKEDNANNTMKEGKKKKWVD